MMSRMFASASILLVIGACADPGVTTPTPVLPPAAIPQSLTFTATPDHVPATGGLVQLEARVTAQPDANLAGFTIEFMQFIGSQRITSLVMLDAAGLWRERAYVTKPVTFVIKAGTLEPIEQIVSIDPPPPLPESPPPVFPPAPPPPPPPAPAPPPAPPQPAITVALIASPNPAVMSAPPSQTVSVTFTATATSVNGAGAATAYEWDLDGIVGFEDVTAAPTNTRTRNYTTAKIMTAAVRVLTAAGLQASGSVTLIIASAVVP